MTYHELKALVESLIDEHGAEDFLTATAMVLYETDPRSAYKIQDIRQDLWMAEGYR